MRSRVRRGVGLPQQLVQSRPVLGHRRIKSEDGLRDRSEVERLHPQPSAAATTLAPPPGTPISPPTAQFKITPPPEPLPLCGGGENIGVHGIVTTNPQGVDLEIALSQGETGIDMPPFDDRGARQPGRPAGQTAANPSLRTWREKRVVTQIETSIRLVDERRDAMLDSYRIVSRSLVALAAMRGGARAVSPVSAKVVDGPATLERLSRNVGLIVFGFDEPRGAAKAVRMKWPERPNLSPAP